MEYPSDFVDHVIHGDCLDVLKEIPDDSIQLVFTSPEYYGAPMWENNISYNNYLEFQKSGVVLDPFAGVGTTALACVKSGRHYILIEKEEKYCEVARKRIKKVTGQSSLDSYLEERGMKNVTKLDEFNQ